jgi:hypothetical protein
MEHADVMRRILDGFNCESHILEERGRVTKLQSERSDLRGISYGGLVATRFWKWQGPAAKRFAMCRTQNKLRYGWTVNVNDLKQNWHCQLVVANGCLSETEKEINRSAHAMVRWTKTTPIVSITGNKSLSDKRLTEISPLDKFTIEMNTDNANQE